MLLKKLACFFKLLIIRAYQAFTNCSDGLQLNPRNIRSPKWSLREVIWRSGQFLEYHVEQLRNLSEVIFWKWINILTRHCSLLKLKLACIIVVLLNHAKRITTMNHETVLLKCWTWYVSTINTATINRQRSPRKPFRWNQIRCKRLAVSTFFGIGIFYRHDPHHQNKILRKCFETDEHEEKGDNNSRILNVEQGSFTLLAFSIIGRMDRERPKLFKLFSLIIN